MTILSDFLGLLLKKFSIYPHILAIPCVAKVVIHYDVLTNTHSVVLYLQTFLGRFCLRYGLKYSRNRVFKAISAYNNLPTANMKNTLQFATQITFKFRNLLGATAAILVCTTILTLIVQLNVGGPPSAKEFQDFFYGVHSLEVGDQVVVSRRSIPTEPSVTYTVEKVGEKVTLKTTAPLALQNGQGTEIQLERDGMNGNYALRKTRNYSFQFPRPVEAKAWKKST